MNIMVYTHHYPVTEGLGIIPDTKVVHYFVKELQKKGHVVQVVYLYYTPVKEIFRHRFREILPKEMDYEIEGVPVHLIKYQMLTPRRSHPEKFQADIINKRIRALKQRLNWKADRVFIHFPTMFAGLTEVLADGVPSLGDFHNLDVLVLKKEKTRDEVLAFIREIKTWGYRNKNVYEYLTHSCGREPVPVYTGIDSSLLADPAWIERKKTQTHDALRILYAGQLIPLKNVDTVIEAVRQLPFAYDLTIVGDGSEMDRLRSMAQGDPAIRFTGWLPRNDTIKAMGDADVFVMVSSPETYGMVYLEAMAQGCITVASRGEGFDGLIVDGENGFLAQPGSVEETKEVLCKIHNMRSEERAQILQKGYELSQAMTEDRTTEGFLAANV